MKAFLWQCNKYLAYLINVLLVCGLIALLGGFVWGLTVFVQS
jgi:predicted ABC-type exoprotein transport system permease subunit